MNTLEVPEILNIPRKLLPILNPDILNSNRYILLDGGRGSAKSNSICRFIIFLAEQKKLRIVCGRETQNSIQESVYALISDLIRKYSLNFDVQANKIIHRITGSVITFRGFREQGSFNIQGMEGVDIVFVDEAQAITKLTLDRLIPTVRKDKAKIFFAMNRFLRHDPVYEFCSGRKDCFHIKINFNENEFCPESLKNEAETCRLKNESDYRHIWLGEPVDQAVDYLFSFEKLDKTATIKPFGDLFVEQSVMGVDLAAGGDLCVASLLERKSNVHWQLVDQRAWSEKDTDVSVGKTLALKALWEPTLCIVDKGGLGLPMYNTMCKTSKDIYGFDGAGEARLPNSKNQRTDGYLCLKEFVDQEWLILGKYEQTRKEMETIKREYASDGRLKIQSKDKMREALKKIGADSPDHSDSVMMALYGIRFLLGKVQSQRSANKRIVRLNNRRQDLTVSKQQRVNGRRFR